VSSVFARGNKAAPRWYARFLDADRVWRSKRVRQETKKDALAVARALEAQAERQRVGLERPAVTSPTCGALMQTWAAGLTNRSRADDRCRLRLHVLPRFAKLRIADVTLPVLMTWLDELRAAGRLQSGTQRHLLNLVSRFFGWCVERGHADVNPVRLIPSGRRPQHAPKRNVPWLEDDGIVTTLMNRLPEAVGLMFYIGTMSGLRLGELAGLRLSDLDGVADGVLRVRYSYTGPLKEDRHGAGKVKWAPAPDDAMAVLGPWLERRRAQGAAAEAFVFARADGTHLRKEFVEWTWERARDALGLKLTFYEATRHTFASRNLSRGVPLDEVASALGHSTPAVTARHYAHFIRKTFSPGMRAALQAPGGALAGKVLQLSARAPMSPAPAIATDDADDLRPTGTETRKAGAR
jgi:integrase